GLVPAIGWNAPGPDDIRAGPSIHAPAATFPMVGGTRCGNAAPRSGIRLPVRIHEPALVQIAAPKREADHREQARMPLATPYRPWNETNIATPMVAATAPSIPPPLLAPCRRKRRDTYERSHERRDEEGERRHGRSVATRGIEVGASRTAAGA